MPITIITKIVAWSSHLTKTNWNQTLLHRRKCQHPNLKMQYYIKNREAMINLNKSTEVILQKVEKVACSVL